MDRGKTDFYFVDPNFIGPGKTGKEQALILARSLAELDITFGMECRAKTSHLGSCGLWWMPDLPHYC